MECVCPFTCLGLRRALFMSFGANTLRNEAKCHVVLELEEKHSCGLGSSVIYRT